VNNGNPRPTTDARLTELTGKFGEGTTGWPMEQLSPDDIADVYEWFQWIQIELGQEPT
jgi:hypothetical protein